MPDVSDYLPDIYQQFRQRFPRVAESLDQAGMATQEAGPLDDRTQRLVKLGIAVGALAEGAVRSSARRALDLGVSDAELRHVAVLAITTAGFPTAIAGLGWIEEVLAARP